MKRLRELLQAADLPSVESDIIVSGLTANSQAVQAGMLFIAWKGHAQDGHDYIPEALARGAAALVIERPIDVPVPAVVVSNARRAYAQLCSAWFDHPARRLTLVGITGTNGKSSTAYYLYQLWQALGLQAGLIGTVFCKIGDETQPATLTTPDSYVLHELLRRCADRGVTHVAMEVSSIALDQHRTTGIDFTGAIFTNLSHDHLDYHGTFTAYRDAKKLLFDGLKSGAFALVNVADRHGPFMLQNTAAIRYGYAVGAVADFQAVLEDVASWGLKFRLEINLLNHPQSANPITFSQLDLHSPLIGAFQLENLLAAYGASFLTQSRGLAEKAQQALAYDLAVALSNVRGLPGRVEPVPLSQDRLAIVDYAHTPDAMEKVLRTLRPLVQPGGRLVVVVGAGGNRDRTKRAPMGQIAALHADLAFFTSDNPRYEDPETILADMYAPLEPSLRAKVFCLPDRREAIQKAIAWAPPGSLIAVLGKGHETYQEIQGVRHPFSDRDVLLAYCDNPYAG